MKPNKPTMEDWKKGFRLDFSALLIDLCNKESVTMGDLNDLLKRQIKFIKDLLAKHSQTKVEEESYTPEQIIQAYSIVLSKHGKMFMDELILELKRNFKTELKNTGGKK